MAHGGFTVWAMAALALGWVLGVGHENHQPLPPLDRERVRLGEMIQQGNTRSALLDLRRLLRRVEGDQSDAAMAIRLWWAKLAKQRDDRISEIAALREIPDSAQHGATARAVEGDAWLKLEYARHAENCWRRALARDPELALARTRLLGLFALQIRRQDWETILWELYDRRQTGITEMVQLVASNRIVWAIDEVLPLVLAKAQADPQDPHSRRAVGIFLGKAGRWNESIAWLQAAHRDFPEHLPILLALVEAQLSGGEGNLALATLADAPAEWREDPRFLKWRGMAFLSIQKPYKARSDLLRAVSRWPYDLELHQRLAETYRLTKEPRKGVLHGQIAARLGRLDLLCYSMHVARWDAAIAREIILLCEQVGMVEEARGWARLGLARVEEESLDEWRGLLARLEMLPSTSGRRPPPLEVLLCVKP